MRLLGTIQVCMWFFLLADPVSAQFTQIYVGPAGSSSSMSIGGGRALNANGRAAGTIIYPLGSRSFSWGSQPIVEGQPIAGAVGNPSCVSKAINASGQIVGYADKYATPSSDDDWRPVRWSSSGEITELGVLGTTSGDITTGSAEAINNSGIAAGYVMKYVGGTTKGHRAVRWDAAGAVTELSPVWTDSAGFGESQAGSINERGQVCGYTTSYGSTGLRRAVRWEEDGTPTVLSLPTDFTSSTAGQINSSGQVAGTAGKQVPGVSGGRARPVRWDSSGTMTELGILGVGAAHSETVVSVHAINDNGQVVGAVMKYDSGVSKGPRPVRWDDDGTPIELDLLGIPDTGSVFGRAYDINVAGFAAGYVDAYDTTGTYKGQHAVYWRPDGTVVDLNSLIDPLSGWLLKDACAITDNGWIAGIAAFDPDGAGPGVSYSRVFLMQIPEPSTAALVGIGGMLVLSWRRRIG